MSTHAFEVRPIAATHRPVRRVSLHRSGLDRSWVAAILFLNGWDFSLPVSSTPLPFWVTPIQVVHGVFLHEALFIAYVGFTLLARAGSLPFPRGRAQRIAILIAGLGAIGVLSAVANLRPPVELVAALRYFVLAVYFALAVKWTRKYRPIFVLRTYLLGLLAAGIVTLYFTFTLTHMTLGGLPMLLGQNGPGGYLGMTVILGAWLMMIRTSRFDTLIAMGCFGVGILGTSISYSKSAMLLAAIGGTAWLAVLLQRFNTRRTRRWTAIALLALAAIGFAEREPLSDYADGVNRFIEMKFQYIDSESVRARYSYFLITSEILLRHPLVGVGPGGFYAAERETDAHKSPWAGAEDVDAGAKGQAHPESSFLYYACADGLIGLFLVISIFFFSVGSLRRAFADRGTAGTVVWACCSLGYMIFGLTLPTLFNTSILYLPVAVAICSDRMVAGYRRSRVGPDRTTMRGNGHGKHASR